MEFEIKLFEILNLKILKKMMHFLSRALYEKKNELNQTKKMCNVEELVEEKSEYKNSL